MQDQLQGLEVLVAQTESQIAYLAEVLQKSEKYERLMQDSDFKEVLKDIQQTIDAHDGEIKSCLAQMSEYTVKLEQDAFHAIRIHQVLKEQAQRAMNRPSEILELAKNARTKLPELREQLSKLKEQING